MNKESNIFGILFPLIFFVVALSVFIDGFIWFFVYHPLRQEIASVYWERVERVKSTVYPTPTLTATPSASLSPTVTQTFLRPRPTNPVTPGK